MFTLPSERLLDQWPGSGLITWITSYIVCLVPQWWSRSSGCTIHISVSTADFVLLMCASQQWKVFECEHTREWMVLAGENIDDPEHVDGRLCNPAANFINCRYFRSSIRIIRRCLPVSCYEAMKWPDYVSLPLIFCRSYLDMAKVLVFRHLFWFVLSVVFITGATRISVFGLGYLLACFFFLLFGTHFLVKPCRTRLNLWDCLIIYNVAVIISKNMLSVSMI